MGIQRPADGRASFDNHAAGFMARPSGFENLFVSGGAGWMGPLSR
jgi:hypothetical protein